MSVWRSSGGPPSDVRPAAPRGAIAEQLDWSAPPEGAVRGWLRAPSGLLATMSMGPAHGPSVVLVPGVTGSKEDFSLVMPRLARAGCRVVSFDMAGQYESCAAGPEHLDPPRHRYDYDLFVHDLIAVLSAQPSASHVLGYSFAGIIGQLVLARRPDLVASLALMSCPPQPGRGLRGVPVVGALSGLARGRADAAVMIWAVRHNVNHVSASRLRFVRDRFALTRRESVVDVFALMQQAPDLRASVRAAPVPKLVAVGDRDVWPLELHRRFADAIGARLAVYPGGHSPCETSPAALSDDLLALIALARGRP